jgi:GH35 family endo-1,4-beta-xylanase
MRTAAWLALILTSGLGGLRAQTYPYSIVPSQEAEMLARFGVWGSAARKEISYPTEVPFGAGFTQALRLRTLSAPATEYAEGEWSCGAAVDTVAAVSQGDLLVARFWIRAVEGREGTAYTRFIIEKNGPNYDKLLSIPIACGPQWRLIERVCAGRDYSAAGLHVVFYLGYSPQCFEVAGLSVVDYGRDVSASDLGIDSDTYEGREPGAEWRTAAANRIDRHRKADLVVQVVDRGGFPVRDAQIEVRMLRHYFGFGSAVTAELLTSSSPDAVRYREMVGRLYNKVVFENDLKWSPWENLSARPRLFQALSWLRSLNIAVRGHCLVWPGWSNMPGDVRNLAGEALRNRIRNHVLDEAGAPDLVAGLAEWDVLNEPYSNHDVMDILGKAEMGAWFALASQASPNTELYVNDYDILEAEGGAGRHQEHFYKTIDYLKNQLQAPIHGIGLQCHFSGRLTPPVRILEILDAFGRFGLPLQATELDIGAPNEQLQADYLRDFMTALFSHPSVNGILMWGFWEGRHWRPEAALYRRDWSLKPAAKAWEDLVFGEWWTNVDASVDEHGRATVRGFKGDYEVRVRVGQQTCVRYVALLEDRELLIRVPFDRAGENPRREGELERRRRWLTP